MNKLQNSNLKIQINSKLQFLNHKIDHWLLFGLCILMFGISNRASAATIFSQAANQDVYAGQTFVLDWYLDTENKPINAVDLGLSFSTDTLEVVDASTGNSLINL